VVSSSLNVHDMRAGKVASARRDSVGNLFVVCPVGVGSTSAGLRTERVFADRYCNQDSSQVVALERPLRGRTRPFE
jgi:hypothetical protein